MVSRQVTDSLMRIHNLLHCRMCMAFLTTEHYPGSVITLLNTVSSRDDVICRSGYLPMIRKFCIAGYFESIPAHRIIGNDTFCLVIGETEIESGNIASATQRNRVISRYSGLKEIIRVISFNCPAFTLTADNPSIDIEIFPFIIAPV